MIAMSVAKTPSSGMWVLLVIWDNQYAILNNANNFSIIVFFISEVFTKINEYAICGGHCLF